MRGEIIGSGAQKEVIGLNESTARITFARDRKIDDRLLKAFFLFHKIAHALFPKNIPAVKEYGRDSDGKAYVDVERISHDAFHAFQQFKRGSARLLTNSHNAHEVQYYFNAHERDERKLSKRADFLRKMRGAGFTVVDGSSLNFSYHEGGVKYLDIELPWMNGKLPVLNFNPSLLRTSIQRIDDERVRDETLSDFEELLRLIKKEQSKKI